MNEINFKIIYESLIEGNVIKHSDRDEYGIANANIEILLNNIVDKYNFLLHGTDQIIKNGSPLRLSPGRERYGKINKCEGFATHLASIALLKALFSNRHANLKYSYKTSIPLKLTIQGWNPNVERDFGYIHLIYPKSSFVREYDTWQWVTTDRNTFFGGCIEVIKSDFKYPIEKK